MFVFFASQISAIEAFSSIDLPKELDQTKPFNTLCTQLPTLNYVWQHSNTLILPLPADVNILISQSERSWNLKTQPVEKNQELIVYKAWHQAAQNSQHRHWHQLPLKRQLSLGCIALLFAFICYHVQSNYGKACLAILALAAFFCPMYQNAFWIHLDANTGWMISKSGSAPNTLQYANQSKIGLTPFQLEMPEANTHTTNSAPALDWLSPNLNYHKRIDHFWSSDHHLNLLRR